MRIANRLRRPAPASFAGSFRWLVVRLKHISLLTDGEGKHSLGPFRHLRVAVEQGEEGDWREICN
jgi:hypothetical protein